MSNFAKAELLKYGWTEGKGLGKNENGIAQAIRPKLKFDTTGIGHKESDYEWWNSLYNKAASNIVLEKQSDQVSISVADKNAVNISSKNEAAFAKATLYHGKFLKTSTLQDGNMVKDKTCQSLEDKGEASGDPFVQMTDEELFKACGGRTAHKGARHGLTLSGKLNRIAEQERQLLANGGLKSCKKSTQGQFRDKKKNKQITEAEIPPLDIEESDDLVLPVSPVYNEEKPKPSKHSVKKNKRKIQDLVHQLSKTCMIEESARYDEENSPQDTSEDSTQRKNKKKKKSKRKRDQAPEGNNDSDTSAACLLDDDVSMEPSSKKKKKVDNSSVATFKEDKACNPDDPTHMCPKCDEFYEHHQKVYEKYYKKVASSIKMKKRNKKHKEQCSKLSKEESGTEWTAKKLNKRISKRKDKKIQKKEKKKRVKNLVLPARLNLEPLDEAAIQFTGIKI